MSSRFSALNFGYVAFAVTSSRFFISIPPLFICPPKRAPYPSSSSIKSAARNPSACATLHTVTTRGFGDGPSIFSMLPLDTPDRFASSRIDILLFILASFSLICIFTPQVIFPPGADNMHQLCPDYITKVVLFWWDKCKFLTFLRFAQFPAGFLCI